MSKNGRWRLDERANFTPYTYNPLRYLLVVLPQKAWAALRWITRHPTTKAAAVHDKLTYYASGYVTVVEKP